MAKNEKPCLVANEQMYDMHRIPNVSHICASSAKGQENPCAVSSSRSESIRASFARSLRVIAMGHQWGKEVPVENVYADARTSIIKSKRFVELVKASVDFPRRFAVQLWSCPYQTNS